jgi:flagellar export protein FliJ
MPKQLELVLSLREKEEEKARQQLSVAEQRLDILQQQLKSLEDFALSYQQQLSAPGKIQMQHRQTIVLYLSQVQDAILGQAEKATFAAEHVETAKNNWLAVRLKKQGIATLIEKRKHEQYLLEEKKEQQEADALSQILFFRNK